VNKRLILALSIACPLTIAGSAGANEIFDKNCAACHAGGGNIMNPEKTLTKESLQKSGMDSVNAVKKRVSEGKAPMPAFKGTLSDAQIDEVAAFVIEQSNKGW
jgi:cytochrome c6